MASSRPREVLEEVLQHCAHSLPNGGVSYFFQVCGPIDSDSDSDTNSDEKLTLNEMMERAALSKASGPYSEKKLYVREVIS